MAQKRKTSQPKKRSPRKVVKVKHAGETAQGLTGIVRENYLIGIDAAHSVIEENKRLVDAQFEQMNKIQREYIAQMKKFIGKLPKEYSDFGLADRIDRMIEFQQGYLSIVKKASDNYTKEILDLNQKSAERAFSAIDRYVGYFSR